MDARIRELLEAGATPDQIYEEAVATAAKMKSNEKLDKARLALIQAVTDYAEALDPDLAKELNDENIEKLDQALRDAEEDIRKLQALFKNKRKVNAGRSDPRDDDAKIRDFLKAIGAA